MTDDNANLDLVNMNAYIIFGKIMSISFKVIELKQKSDIKVHNPVRNVRIVIGNILNLDLSISMHMQNVVKFNQ